jgi:hypothetical protein
MRIGLVLTAIALLTYLPQFFFPPSGRIGHGIVLAAGLLLLAYALLRAPRTASARSSEPTAVAHG